VEQNAPEVELFSIAMDRLVSRKMDGVSIGYCECRRIIAFDFLLITFFNCLLEQLVGRDAANKKYRISWMKRRPSVNYQANPQGVPS